MCLCVCSLVFVLALWLCTVDKLGIQLFAYSLVFCGNDLVVRLCCIGAQCSSWKLYLVSSVEWAASGSASGLHGCLACLIQQSANVVWRGRVGAKSLLVGRGCIAAGPVGTVNVSACVRSGHFGTRLHTLYMNKLFRTVCQTNSFSC